MTFEPDRRENIMPFGASKLFPMPVAMALDIVKRLAWDQSYQNN